MTIELVAINVLFLEQTLDANMKAFSFQEHLEFHEALVINLNPQRARSVLFFNQSVIVEHTALLSVADTLVYTEAIMPKVFDLVVEQPITFAQDLIYGYLLPGAQDYFELEDEAIGFRCRAGRDTFTPTDVALCQIYAAPQMLHTLTMQSNATCYKPDKNWLNGDFTVEAP